MGFSSFPPPSPSLKKEPHFHLSQEGVIIGSLASTLFVPEPHIFGLGVGEEPHFHSFHLVCPQTTHLWVSLSLDHTSLARVLARSQRLGPHLIMHITSPSLGDVGFSSFLSPRHLAILQAKPHFHPLQDRAVTIYVSQLIKGDQFSNCSNGKSNVFIKCL